MSTCLITGLEMTGMKGTREEKMEREREGGREMGLLMRTFLCYWSDLRSIGGVCKGNAGALTQLINLFVRRIGKTREVLDF